LKLRKNVENKPLYIVSREEKMTRRSEVELTKLLEWYQNQII